MEYVINFIRGFFMALADSVPGVSGGTIAFVLGFYDNFITALDDLFRGDFKKKKKAFFYLIKIGIGWVVGFLIAASFLSSLFENHIYELSSLFLGFIIVSLPFIIIEEIKSLKGKYYNIVWFFIGLLFVVGITLLNGTDILNINLTNPNLMSYIYTFLVAAIAICAMVLPGISGSTVLLIFGLYVPIMEKIKILLGFDFSAFPILFIFGLGVIFGIFSFAKIVRKSLEKNRGAVIYAILGMMVGSIYAIIMGPTTLENALPMLSFDSFNILMFLLGIVIIIALEKAKDILAKKRIK